jgi:hypothetical protein
MFTHPYHDVADDRVVSDLLNSSGEIVTCAQRHNEHLRRSAGYVAPSNDTTRLKLHGIKCHQSRVTVTSDVVAVERCESYGR